MAADFQDVKAEVESGATKILIDASAQNQATIILWDLDATHHTSRMIPEVIPTRVHHPKIRVTQCPIEKSTRLLPGLAHIAQHHIHSLLRISFLCIIYVGRRVLPFAIEISLRQLSIKRDISSVVWIRVRVHMWPQSASAIRVTQEGSDTGLNVRGEEIALDG
jgi:hypothetical protein